MICNCEKIPSIIHELLQSLLIIQAYANGCTQRLQDNNVDPEQFINCLNKISDQVQKLSSKIHEMI